VSASRRLWNKAARRPGRPSDNAPADNAFVDSSLWTARYGQLLMDSALMDSALKIATAALPRDASLRQ